MKSTNEAMRGLMQRRGMKHLVGAGAVAIVNLMLASSAQAGDLRAAAGVTATATEWRGDAAAYGSLKLGYRFLDMVGVYVQGHEGYGLVDDRMLTLISLGAQLWGRLGILRPYARLAALHQHEESLSVVADAPLKAVFGIGDGIRHRAGGEFGAGLELPLWQDQELQFFGSAEMSVKLFPDDLGPVSYFGTGLALGVSYSLDGASGAK